MQKTVLQPMDNLQQRYMLIHGNDTFAVHRMHLFDAAGVMASFDWLTGMDFRLRAEFCLILDAPAEVLPAPAFDAAPVVIVPYAAMLNGMRYADLYLAERLLPVSRVDVQHLHQAGQERCRYQYRIVGLDACFMTWDHGIELRRRQRDQDKEQVVMENVKDIQLDSRRDAWL